MPSIKTSNRDASTRNINRGRDRWEKRRIAQGAGESSGAALDAHIAAADPHPQYLTPAEALGFGTVAVSGQSDIVADSVNDTLTLVAGSNVTLTTSAGGDSVTIAAAGGNAFGTVAVSGQSDVVADQANDTLTLVAGTNITLTTSAAGDSVTIAASGGGGSLTSVARTIVSGAAVTTVSFTGLDLDAAGMYIIKFAIANTATTANYYMYFNGDTTAANYHYQQVAGTNNATNGAEVANALLVNIQTGMFGNGSIEIQAPSGTNQLLSRANTAAYVSATNLTVTLMAHLWKNSANPTQIDFTADVASAIGIGSYFEVFKLTY